MASISRLLYVDSDTATATAHVAKLTADYEFEVYQAADIATAITALRTNSIDCVISEFDLGESDGFDLLSHIRSDFGSLPVVLLVDDDPSEVDSKAFTSGSTLLFPRSQIEHSLDPLVERVHDFATLSSAASNASATTEADGTALGGSAGSSAGDSVGDDEQSGQSGETVPFDSLIENWPNGELTRSRLEPLGKDELITLLLELQNTAMADDERVGTTTEPSGAASTGSHPTTAESSPVESETVYRPETLDLSPGTKLLVQSTAQDDRKHDLHLDLLGLDDDRSHNILLIRYRPLPPEQLETIAANALRVTVISVGCHQPVPPSVRDAVETIRTTNPGDVRRLGILATRTVSKWRNLSVGIRVSIDPLHVLFNYKPVEAVFRFMHALLGKLSQRGAVTQVHVNPAAAGTQNTNTIKMLFDYLLTIDSQGVTVEKT